MISSSPRVWFDKFSHVVSTFGFQRSHADHSVFVRQRSTSLTILAVYIDDIIVTGSGIEKIMTQSYNCKSI